MTFNIQDNKELEQKFIEEAKKEGIIGLNGFFSVGGIRACAYNSMPTEGVEALTNFMKKFKQENY